MGCGGSVPDQHHHTRSGDYSPGSPAQHPPPCTSQVVRRQDSSVWAAFHTPSVVRVEERDALDGLPCKEPGPVAQRVRAAGRFVASRLSLGLGCVEFDERAEQAERSLRARSDPQSLKAKRRVGAWVIESSPGPEDALSVSAATDGGGGGGGFEEGSSAADEAEAELCDADGKPLPPLSLYFVQKHTSLMGAMKSAEFSRVWACAGGRKGPATATTVAAGGSSATTTETTAGGSPSGVSLPNI